MQNLRVYYLCLCCGLQAQHVCESKIYFFIKERNVLSKNDMVNPGICKCKAPVDEWVRHLPAGTILGEDYHWPCECKQEVHRSSDRSATRQHYTPDHLDFVMEKENPYQATRQLTNHPSPPGWARKIVSLTYMRRKKKQLGHGMEPCLE